MLESRKWAECAKNSGGKYELKGQREREKCGPNRQVGHDAPINLK